LPKGARLRPMPATQLEHIQLIDKLEVFSTKIHQNKK
jgi:hypothetical protein